MGRGGGSARLRAGGGGGLRTRPGPDVVVPRPGSTGSASLLGWWTWPGGPGQPSAAVTDHQAERLRSRLRQKDAALICLGRLATQPTPTLSVTGSTWFGLGRGHGHLHGRQVEVRVQPRRLAAHGVAVAAGAGPAGEGDRGAGAVADGAGGGLAIQAQVASVGSRPGSEDDERTTLRSDLPRRSDDARARARCASEQTQSTGDGRLVPRTGRWSPRRLTTACAAASRSPWSSTARSSPAPPRPGLEGVRRGCAGGTPRHAVPS